MRENENENITLSNAGGVACGVVMSNATVDCNHVDPFSRFCLITGREGSIKLDSVEPASKEKRLRSRYYREVSLKGRRESRPRRHPNERSGRKDIKC